MSKGSKRRRGANYESNYDSIFRKESDDNSKRAVPCDCARGAGADQGDHTHGCATEAGTGCAQCPSALPDNLRPAVAGHRQPGDTGGAR